MPVAPADIITTYAPDFQAMGLTATVAGDAVQLATPDTTKAWAAGQALNPAIQGVRLIGPAGGVAPASSADANAAVTSLVQSLPTAYRLMGVIDDMPAQRLYVSGATAAEAAANIAHLQPLLAPKLLGEHLEFGAYVPNA